MKSIRNILVTIAAALAISASAAVAAPTGADDQKNSNPEVMKQVRKELVTLPYYGVFDNLAYKVEGGTVTLYGQVTRPTTRSDAARRVARIKGVTNVVNNIEVLPLSGFDDSIRIRTYRTLYHTGGLYRYALGTNPSIHIIVKNGHVSLEGVVDSEGDSRLAYIAARGVPGSFSVTNNLRVASSGGR